MASTSSFTQSEIDSQSRLRLTARYRWMLLVVVMPLFIVIALLAVNQFRDQRAQVLHSLAQNTSSYTIALDDIAKLASDHVLQMKAWSENYLRSPPSYPSDLRAYYTPRYVDSVLDSYTLDQVPEEERQYIGQLVWLGSDPRNLDVVNVSLDQALEFFSLARLTHDLTPYFQWSYFFSSNKDVLAVYPWFSAEQILESSEKKSLQDALASWFEYEIYLAGTPEQNPERNSYWTEPYIDAGGAGAMVSLGAPVYVKDAFKGIVGTDVTLITLEKFLNGLPMDVGRLLILNNEQMLLADTAGLPDDRIIKVNETLTGIPDNEAFLKGIQTNGDIIDMQDQVLVAHHTSHAPWTLVYLISDEAITGLLLPRLMPYAVILAVLSLTVGITLFVLRKEFISPAFALVGYLRDASREPLTPVPKLPTLWQTWAGLIAKTFDVNYKAAQLIQDSEQRLQQILNNSSAVVYVRNLDERFILVNQPLERLLDVRQEDIIGKSLDEVFPAETAAEFRANDMQVISGNKTMEFEEYVTLEDGVHTYISNKFPLYDSKGDIYAVCGISTDITKRKHTEEALRQAALGISEAKGSDLFNTLVMHLSQALDTDFALIGVLEGEDHIRTRALYAHGEVRDNITYELKGSPCENVVGQQFRFYPDTIQQRFPEDGLLVDIGVQSYAAIPLFDSESRVLGLLAVLDDQPLQDRELIESMLQIFSGRATSELERERKDAELRASESSYRAIFEASEACIFVHDMDTGAILDVNSRTSEVYGYTSEEMHMLNVGDLSSGVPPYTLEDGAALIQRAINGERLSFEWHRKNKDGSLHWDEVFLRRASIGGHDRILAFTREITARKEAEEKLRTSEAQYREANLQLRDSEAFKTAIVENALLGVITINEAGKIIEFNPAAVEMFGYRKQQAVDSNLAELIIPESMRQSHKQGLQRYLRSGESRVLNRRMEMSAMRSDGTEFPIEMSISQATIGQAKYFTAFIADLTEKKAAEATIRASEEQYRSIFYTSSDALILWDAQGNMVDANPAAWEMGGYTRKEFFSKPFDEHIHPSSLAAFNQFKEDVVKNKAAYTETRVIRKDGSVIELESRSISMPYKGQPHILTITRDITEQKRVAEELARQREALRQSEKLSAMGELLAGVAHELNNPLAILMGRTSLLENKTRDPAIREDVRKIHSAADRCGRIVHTFLSMARQKPPKCEPASINDVVTGAIDLLGYGLRTADIELVTRLGDALPEPEMDADQIGQIIINLLVNAQHVLIEQPIPRRIELETGIVNYGVYCRVSDNGPGIPDEVMQRIFDPFFTTKDSELGTGIGLSVSRTIAREHGGELKVESSERGATFTLWLPLDSMAPDKTANITPDSSGGFQTEHVLIVDDEPELTAVLAEILHSAGLDTTQVHSGQEALHWLENNHCDFILTDIRMPDMDGPALWRELNKRYPELSRRTAFITGDTLSASIAPFLQQTGQPWLEKPFTPDQVLELIARTEVT